jgi:hypothetical protein
LPLGTLPQHPNAWAHALMRTGLAAVNLKSGAEIAAASPHALRRLILCDRNKGCL